MGKLRHGSKLWPQDPGPTLSDETDLISSDLIRPDQSDLISPDQHDLIGPGLSGGCGH